MNVHQPENGKTGNHVAQLAEEMAGKASEEVFQLLGTSPEGLSEEEAAARLVQYGVNEVAHEKKQSSRRPC